MTGPDAAGACSTGTSWSARVRSAPTPHQTNKNLLLSDRAEADTRPRLEIYADDVKCTHGAAVGQLDEDAVFYLRSRGIDEQAARRVLVDAFIQEMIDRVSILPVRERLTTLLAARALA